MTTTRAIGAALLAALSLATAAAPPRLVTLGGPVTETVFALGSGSQVIAVDVSSTWPPEAAALPKVGYHRALSAEGILSLRPGLVIGTDEAGPPTALRQMKDAGTRVELVPVEHTVEGTRRKILAISALLGKEDAGRKLVASLEADLEVVKARIAASKSRPRVLFIYARGQGTLSVSGRATAADAIIALAGGVNAVTGYEGYKPLTPEALAAARPDVILLTTSGLESVGGKATLLDQPGVALTPAGKNGRIESLDDGLLLNFGPRLGKGALELARRLHPEVR